LFHRCQFRKDAFLSPLNELYNISFLFTSKKIDCLILINDSKILFILIKKHFVLPAKYLKLCAVFYKYQLRKKSFTIKLFFEGKCTAFDFCLVKAVLFVNYIL